MGFYITLLQIVIVVLLAIELLVRFCVTIYVYRDSKKRDMNASLWTIIVFLTPICVGLVVYLILRQLEGKTKCTRCGTFIKKDYCKCPNCGLVIKKTCPLCGKKVDPSWLTCAWCGEQLSQ